LTCGEAVGQSIGRNKITQPIVEADQTLAERYQDQRNKASENIDQKHIRIQRAEGNIYRKEYEDYRRSEIWRMKRKKVLKRAKGICEGCLDAEATQIHHITYDHIGDELLFELVALCDACHRKCHPNDNQVSLIEDDMDGLPCLACRYQAFESGKFFCARFNMLSSLALSPIGECGPNASALEPLK
jgi:5-methylcytosine-specific restriction endonuclease McrA